MTHCPHCGADLTTKPKGKPRSVPQHRRYFALIKSAYHNWPETHDFTPQNEDHLRKWLQAKAGHRVVRTIDAGTMTPAQAVAAVAAAMKEAGPYTFTAAVDSKLYVISSASIDFDTLPHLAACALFDEVAEIIEAETGIRCDDLIKPAPRAKAKRQINTEVPL